MNTFRCVPRNKCRFLSNMSNIKPRLLDLPWENIANVVSRSCTDAGSAQEIMRKAELQSFMKAWMKECDIVRKTITWELFTETPSEHMQLFSQPGGWLFDHMFIDLSIERGKLTRNSNCCYICNGVYVKMAQALIMIHRVYNNETNVRNMLESLCWLAFEQKKYRFIFSLVHHAADIHWKDNDDFLLPGSDLEQKVAMHEPLASVRQGYVCRREERMDLSLSNEDKNKKSSMSLSAGTEQRVLPKHMLRNREPLASAGQVNGKRREHRDHATGPQQSIKRPRSNLQHEDRASFPAGDLFASKSTTVLPLGQRITCDSDRLETITCTPCVR